MSSRPDEDPAVEMPQEVDPKTLVLLVGGVLLGVVAAVVVLPLWLPGLSASLAGPQMQAFWYLSRASGVIAFVMVWFSMALGLSITNKLSRVWPGGPTAADLHQYVSLLGLLFILFHGLILLGDQYIDYTLGQILIPFGSTGYRPGWVGLGQIAFYVMVVVWGSFYFRRLIGHARWRSIHFFSFMAFLFALAHGILSGTDSGTMFMKVVYWGSLGSILFLTIYRILYTRATKRNPAVKPAAHPFHKSPAESH